MNIEIRDLNKNYPNGKIALENVNLNIGMGLFGLLGPNGAGKTTLMRILVTLMKPSSGNVRIGQWDLQNDRAQIRRMLGYLPQDFNLSTKLKTWEFLDYSARLAGMDSAHRRSGKVDEMLEKVGLFKVRDRQVRKLSGGMKRRLGIAQALISDPPVLIVDEPTTGLDPEERIRFRNLLTEMAQEDRIILLSTHIVGDISSTCQDMALLNEGRVAFNGPPQQLIGQAKGHTFELQVEDADLLKIKESFPVISTIPSEKAWRVEIVADKQPSASKPIEPNLEHAYVYFMQQIDREFIMEPDL